jgi:hypothetical protein
MATGGEASVWPSRAVYGHDSPTAGGALTRQGVSNMRSQTNEVGCG